MAWAGLAAVVDGRWRLPFVVGAGAGLFFGTGLAEANPAALSDSLLVAGALGIVAGAESSYCARSSMAAPTATSLPHAFPTARGCGPRRRWSLRG